MGMVPRKESSPNRKDEPESCNTSQACAKHLHLRADACEVQAPIHMMRKSR
jgi:hypothetical protein